MPEVKTAFCIPAYKRPHMIEEFMDVNQISIHTAENIFT